MPIYEYQCQSCQHELEALQKMSADHLRECPICGKEELKKKVSAAAFRLKGGGWYETDFKTGDKKNLASSANKESSTGKSEAGTGKGDSSSSTSGGGSSSDGGSTSGGTSAAAS
jgi:putative FmdB family regulatory protein